LGGGGGSFGRSKTEKGAAERNDENADSSDERTDIASQQKRNEIKKQGEAGCGFALLSG
jgi:hypothetical protein